MPDAGKSGEFRRAKPAPGRVSLFDAAALQEVAKQDAKADVAITAPPLGGWSKRLTDICGAMVALVMAAPLLLICAIIIRCTSPGPIFFQHRRIGFRGESFGCLKFRSMYCDAEARLEGILASDPLAREEWLAHQKLARDPRVTPFGAFMRRTSLDELPQFINVLRGQMSLVGPRPIVRAEAPRYGDDYAFYIQARPGITGLWQVSGRSDTSYDTRVALDAAYVTEWTLLRDVQILAQTVLVVLRQKGAV